MHKNYSKSFKRYTLLNDRDFQKNVTKVCPNHSDLTRRHLEIVTLPCKAAYTRVFVATSTRQERVLEKKSKNSPFWLCFLGIVGAQNSYQALCAEGLAKHACGCDCFFLNAYWEKHPKISILRKNSPGAYHAREALPKWPELDLFPSL